MPKPSKPSFTRFTEQEIKDAVAALAKHGGNKAQAARALKIPFTSFRRRLEAAERGGQHIPYTAKPVAAPQIGGTPHDARIVALQDEVTRLTKALKAAHRASTASEIIRDVIGGIARAPRELPKWLTRPTDRPRGKADPEVPVTCWADWHVSEVVVSQEVHGYNEYNMDIAERRVSRLFDKTIMLAKLHHTGNYPGVVVNVVGDIISGGLHPELLKTDELSAIPASLKAIDWLIAGITMFRDAFGQVYVPWVCGNHGRTTAKPEFKKYYQNNWDYLIAQVVAKHFADDPRVHIDIRPSNDVYYRVYGIRYLLNHGDMLGVKGGDGIIGAIGPIMRGEIKKSGQSAALGLEYDVNIMGHWHQGLSLPRAEVSNCLKGFDEYARLQLCAKPSRPTQPLWFVHPSHGRTAHWDVYVDEPPKPAGEWLTVFKEAA